MEGYNYRVRSYWTRESAFLVHCEFTLINNAMKWNCTQTSLCQINHKNSQISEAHSLNTKV